MTATTVKTDWANGNRPTAAQLNAYGKFMSGLMAGAAPNDNDGDPILPLAVNLPAPVRLGADNEEMIAISGPRAYTVPDGKWLVIRQYYHTNAAVTDSITPKGGAAHNLVTGATARIRNGRRIVLGPGDKVTMGGASRCSGLLMDLPSRITPICRTVDVDNPYVVPSRRRLVLTEAIPATTALVTLTVDGGNAVLTVGMDNVDIRDRIGSLLLREAQAVAAATANLILISGVQLRV